MWEVYGSMLGMSCQFNRGYDVLIADGVLDPSSRLLAETIRSRRALIVTTPSVTKWYGDSLRTALAADELDSRILVLELHESTKTMAAALTVCETAQAVGLARRDLMVAFGGGICCDVVSVAASLTRRGLPYVTMPTTLLAQVDAGIGIKGAVNFGHRKNYLGCFNPPERALVDPCWLRTLSSRDLRCGLAEMIKIAVVRDRKLFTLVERHVRSLQGTRFMSPEPWPEPVVRYTISRSVELMLEELEQNAFEDQTLERLLDFGHTFSPLLEERSGYRLAHGEAVAVDIALSCAIAVELGIVMERDADRILDLLRSAGLPIISPECTGPTLEAALEAAAAHRGGTVNLVVPTGVGEATFVRTADHRLFRALPSALRRLQRSMSDHRSAERAPVPVDAATS